MTVGKSVGPCVVPIPITTQPAASAAAAPALCGDLGRDAQASGRQEAACNTPGRRRHDKDREMFPVEDLGSTSKSNYIGHGLESPGQGHEVGGLSGDTEEVASSLSGWAFIRERSDLTGSRWLSCAQARHTRVVPAALSRRTPSISSSNPRPLMITVHPFRYWHALDADPCGVLRSARCAASPTQRQLRDSVACDVVGAGNQPIRRPDQPASQP